MGRVDDRGNAKGPKFPLPSSHSATLLPAPNVNSWSAGNPWITFIFSNQEHDLGDNNQDGVRDGIIEVTSPDPGRALITGRADDFFPFPPGAFDHLNAFKISPLRGIAKTAPYFHDNSAKTLEAVAAHYREFFLIVTGGTLFLDDQDLADMVAFMKLL